MQMRIWTLVSILSLILVAAGCKDSPPAPKHDYSKHDHSQHHGEHAGHAAEPEKADAPAGPKIETSSFFLAVAPAQPKFAAGTPAELEIALEPRGEWHVNEEYPIRVDIKAPEGVNVPKAELVKDDAKEFGADKVRFLASVEPSAAGTHEVSCDVSFAMCTEENCILEKRTVAMELEVQ
jgi:hypothetical protein